MWTSIPLQRVGEVETELIAVAFGKEMCNIWIMEIETKAEL